MNGEDRPSPDRLEQRLRAWGADEDARREQAIVGPWRLKRAVGFRAGLRRWLPLAAGFVLFVAGASFFAGFRVGRREVPGSPDVIQVQEDLGRLRADLASKAKELGELRATLAETQTRLAGQKTASEIKAAKLQRVFEEQAVALAKEAGRQAAEFERAVAEKQAALNEALSQLRVRDERVKGLAEEVAAAVREAEKVRGELAAQATRLREIEATALAARREAQERLASVQAQQAAMISLFQQVYLAGVVPGPEGLRARQVAAREGRVIRRGAALRAGLPDERTRRLFDTLEALLTQLELLDLDDAAQRESFARLLRTLDLTRQVNDVLLSGSEDPAVKGWLIESQLLLKGIERAS